MRVDACDMRVDACDMRVDACDMRVDACDMRVDACDMRVDACDMRVDACDAAGGQQRQSSTQEEAAVGRGSPLLCVFNRSFLSCPFSRVLSPPPPLAPFAQVLAQNLCKNRLGRFTAHAGLGFRV
jgi:hypothetical protein